VGSVEIPSSDGKRRQRVFSKNRNEAIRKLKALKADARNRGASGLSVLTRFLGARMF
jgi:hypothetical protein